jgi:hypothetical protein
MAKIYYGNSLISDSSPTGIIPSYSSASLPWSGTAGQQAFNTSLFLQWKLEEIVRRFVGNQQSC